MSTFNNKYGRYVISWKDISCPEVNGSFNFSLWMITELSGQKEHLGAV